MHNKNLYALRSYPEIQLDEVYSYSQFQSKDLSQYDCVYSPFQEIPVADYPNVKFLFGPHFNVLPDERNVKVSGKNSLYVQPSQWVVDFYKAFPINKELRVEALPFAVDTQRFQPGNKEKSKVFVYFKSRNPEELSFLQNFLTKRGVEYKIFSYLQRYREEDYFQYLQESKYGIILGRHESQGFAIEEALSCNVPLLVWDVTSMNQEYGYNYADYKATCLPYFDERCGAYFFQAEELEAKFDEFVSNLPNYQPRQYILENLSIEVCQKRLISLVSSLSNSE